MRRRLFGDGESRQVEAREERARPRAGRHDEGLRAQPGAVGEADLRTVRSLGDVRDRSAPAHLAAADDDAPFQLPQRLGRPYDPGIRGPQHVAVEAHARPPGARLDGGEDRVRDAAGIEPLLHGGHVETAVRDESVQPQKRLAVDVSERIPAGTGAHEQVEVVLLAVGVVEVAGRAVRCAFVVSAGESLQHHGAKASAHQLPGRGQAHDARAHDHDVHGRRSSCCLPVSDPVSQHGRRRPPGRLEG